MYNLGEKLGEKVISSKKDIEKNRAIVESSIAIYDKQFENDSKSYEIFKSNMIKSVITMINEKKPISQDLLHICWHFQFGKSQAWNELKFDSIESKNSDKLNISSPLTQSTSKPAATPPAASPVPSKPTAAATTSSPDAKETETKREIETEADTTVSTEKNKIPKIDLTKIKHEDNIWFAIRNICESILQPPINKFEMLYFKDNLLSSTIWYESNPYKQGEMLCNSLFSLVQSVSQKEATILKESLSHLTATKETEAADEKDEAKTKAVDENDLNMAEEDAWQLLRKFEYKQPNHIIFESKEFKDDIIGNKNNMDDETKFFRQDSIFTNSIKSLWNKTKK